MSAHRPDPRPKVLRVGLVRAGRIIEERTLIPGEPLRVGASEKNDLVLQLKELGASYDLVDSRRGQYVLRVPSGLRGRIGGSGDARDLTGDEGEIVLEDSCRGRLRLGDATILFQFVPAPAKAGRAQLPASARGGIGRGIDWLFTSFVLASYMGFFGLVVFLENADWELEPANLLPEITARLVFDEPAPPPERLDETPLIDDIPAEDVDDVPEEHADATPQRRDRPSSNAPANHAERNARIREEAMTAARNMVVGAIGESGAFRDVLLGGAPTQDADEVLRLVSVVEFATRPGGEFRERPGGADGSGERDGFGRVVRRDSGREVNTGMVRERVPTGITTLRPPIDEGGVGDIDMRRVADIVRRRLSGIRRCYERELPGNPTLAGKITVEFTVQESGSVSGSRAVENLTGSPTLARCLSSLVGRLRINPAPEGGSVTIRYPFVFSLQD